MSLEVTCATCSFAEDHDVFGRMCTKHMIPVQNHRDSASSKKIAENCSDYTATHSLPQKAVMSPQFLPIGFSPGLMTEAVKRQHWADRPSSCSYCKYYADSSETLKSIGFATPMCVANATLLDAAKSVKIAASCSIGDKGPNFTGNIESIVTFTKLLKPVFERTKADMPGGVKSGAQAANHHSLIDPRDWPTDKPLTEDDERNGIRAWRRISDPKGYGADLFMPILNWRSLIDAQGERLVQCDPRESWEGSKPHLYRDHGGLLYSAAALMMGGFDANKALSTALTLRGEAGTGKTEFFVYLAWLMDVPFTRISITPATEVYHLEGKDTLIGGPNGETIMKFALARFAKAYSKPGVIVVDEWNAGQDEVQFFMRPLIDGAGKFVIESEGISVKRHPMCFLGFTMNPEDNPAYRGTRPLSEADWDRLHIRKLDLPSPEIEREIITSHLSDSGLSISDINLDKLMEVASVLRKKYQDGEIPTPWRLRSQIKVASLLNMFSFEDAFRIAVVDRLEEAVAELFITEVRSIVG